MKIGVSNIYSWRPHNQITKRIIYDLKKNGHEISVLKCFPNNNLCYEKYLRNRNLVNCMKCLALGPGSFKDTTFIKNKNLKDNIRLNETELFSTVSSIKRLSSEENLIASDSKKILNSLKINFQKAYFSALQWIETEKLEFVILYNGRIDLLRAISLACKSKGIPFICHERSWFGPGLNLTWNSNSLSLKKFNNYSEDIFEEKIKYALVSSILAQRFDENYVSNEWIDYRKNFKETANVIPSKLNVLVLPSSPSEFIGEEDFESEFSNQIKSLDLIKEKFPNSKVMVKGHPIWNQKIYELDKTDIDKEFQVACNKNNFEYLLSSKQIDTNNLISQHEIIITFGSSAAVNAGVLGKKVILLGNAEYKYAKYIDNFEKISDFLEAEIVFEDPQVIKKQTFDFVFDFAFQKMHFSDLIYLKRSHLPIFSKNLDMSDIFSRSFDKENYSPTLNQGIKFPDISDSLNFRSVLKYEQIFRF